jgi:GDPmannose 4,6-dehydratase
MLQKETPEDFVIATGVTTTVRDFVRMAFREIGIELEFRGKGIEEVGIVASSKNPLYNIKVGKKIIGIDPQYFRPTEVELLIGDPTKAKEELGWKPKYDLQSLVSEMVQGDLKLFKKDQLLRQAGFEVKNEFE